ncbi:uncharacterized protein N7443_002204 [Penicillium atrosanguineum]|uniref:BZIP domain-containing protein n=1 Tax=Penicillium atrosanguineum TaxID=1132637 RepID=A0A9W9PVX9_9EURO|nr:uncharacterized protein N7443_002204 [Penicillium atrosanguineum]KAJ5309743.1 hypothetical protein N7443_002204 [Penicillium atrosanguineum]KAJ5315265.1 hypothetical protein N7476_005572 [Penicillium atrosanguineum]
MDDKGQKDLQRLARVRDNQRKSRARKQEYTRELEQQLAAYKKEAQQKDIEHRLVLQKLDSENRNLKSLLGSLGVSADLIQQYVNLADQGASVGRKVAIPAMHRTNKPCPSPSPPCSFTASQATDGDQNGNQKIDEKPAVRGVCNAAEVKPTEEQSPQNLKNLAPLCCSGSGQGSSEVWPTMSNDDLMNTTMCAIADELINQYNTSGADIEEIRRRLWSGFRSEKSGDGCRVQNQILFQVLDEISNNI